MSGFENEIDSCNCPMCGSFNERNAKFCSHCGVKLETPIVEKAPVEAEEVLSTPWNNSEININYAPIDTIGSSKEGFNNTNAMPVYQHVPQTDNGKGMMGVSVASMICGILSLICCCSYYFVFVLAIAGLVLGILTIRNGYEGRGMAMAGVVTSGIAIVFWIIIIMVVGAISVTEMFPFLSSYY